MGTVTDEQRRPPRWLFRLPTRSYRLCSRAVPPVTGGCRNPPASAIPSHPRPATTRVNRPTSPPGRITGLPRSAAIGQRSSRRTDRPPATAASWGTVARSAPGSRLSPRPAHRPAAPSRPASAARRGPTGSRSGRADRARTAARWPPPPGTTIPRCAIGRQPSASSPLSPNVTHSWARVKRSLGDHAKEWFGYARANRELAALPIRSSAFSMFSIELA